MDSMKKFILYITNWIKEAYDTPCLNAGISANKVIELNRQDTIDFYKSINIDVY